MALPLIEITHDMASSQRFSYLNSKQIIKKDVSGCPIILHLLFVL